MITLKHSHFITIAEGGKLSRKVKKQVLGSRLNKKKLNKLLASVTLGDPIKTMYERRKILPFAFYPKCGCTDYIGSGNLTSYPEHWEKFKCIRCNNLVGYIDNSPFIHALECADNDYDPSF